MKTISTFLLACGILSAQATQAPNPTQQSTPSGNAAIASAGTPIYRVTVVARTTKAINYNHRSGSTHIGFRGTALMPQAIGEAKVESKQGVIKIDAEMQKLDPATKFGPEYLTYVMWAITPEGRATNVGEVLLNGSGKTKLDATTELQSFGLIVTAEPYFAVTQPSDVVVMENFVRQDTTGTIEQLDAKYELLKRGQYTLNVNPAELRPLMLDKKVPLELYEARNAIQIARWTGAEHYAADTFQKALIGLQNAEGYLIGKSGSKPIGTVAREAVQMAEDARIITVKKIAEEQLASERQAGVDREATAENARAAAKSESERIAREAEMARLAALAETQRVALEHNAQALAAQAETDRLKRDNDAKAMAAQTEADRLKRESDAQLAASKASLDSAAADLARAAAEKTQLRAALLLQFNAILQTRDTARGLIVNMSDVLFDTAKFSLRPQAREKLARVAGILAGHPGLRLQVEGHTDSVGTEEYNQDLSEHRAGSVSDYLTQSGIPADSVTARGFGKTQPVATNDTAAGRQQNRRVELVVSGEIIGMELQSTPTIAVR
jgi:outer membrane protein OmpA-like peptidoglycan-associated protein